MAGGHTLLGDCSASGGVSLEVEMRVEDNRLGESTGDCCKVLCGSVGGLEVSESSVEMREMHHSDIKTPNDGNNPQPNQHTFE